MYSLGVNLSHDRSACLIGDDGQIIAIAEERLDRIKHSSKPDLLDRWHALLPTRSIEYCLQTAGIGYQDLDVVVLCNAIMVIGNELRNLTVADCALQAPWAPHTRLHVINHHLAHAYSAFQPSGFDEATVVVADNSGGVVGYHHACDGRRFPLLERASIYHAHEGRISLVEKISDRSVRNDEEAGLYLNCNSLGSLYEQATVHIGYTPHQVGKIMGLAPFGSLEYVEEMSRHIELTDYGFEISPALQLVTEQLFPNFYRRRFGAPGGQPEDPTANDAAVARAAQEVLEQVMTHLCRLAVERTGCRKLCMAGGIALNSVANTKIRRALGLDEMFVQPASADDGTALGAAVYGWCEILGHPYSKDTWSVSKGRHYSRDEVLKAIEQAPSERFSTHLDADLSEVAQQIAEGRIVGWFHGGSEFGPRALGNRSILADARRTDMKDILNDRVKHREGYRPYAASVLAESAAECFDIEFESPYMLFVVEVLSDWRSKIPSVTHVDGTCRVQMVRREEAPSYHDLIRRFHHMTDVPMVLNTSFNVAGEPIVESPEDAIACFLGTEIDSLFLQGHLLVKPTAAPATA